MKLFTNINEKILNTILDDHPQNSIKKVKFSNQPYHSDDEDNINNEKNTISIFYKGRKESDTFLLPIEKPFRKLKKAETSQNVPVISSNFELPNIFLKSIKFYPIKHESSDKILLQLNKIKPLCLGKYDTIFCQSVDGSLHSDLGYELLTKRFGLISDKHKIIFVYITPTSEEDETCNYRNKKDIILNTYSINMRNLDKNKFFFHFEEKNPLINHHIQQVETVCQKYSCKYLITGYNGLKGSKGDNKLLNKGLEYLLKISKMPLIILKESIFLREEKSHSTSHNWLFIFDKNIRKCFNIMSQFYGLIDPEKDFVNGLTLMPAKEDLDNIEDLFNNFMKEKKFRNYNYQIEKYVVDPHIIIKNKVNFGEIEYDFVVIYNYIGNNEIKISLKEKQYLSTLSIVNSCSSNICILNGN